MPVVRGTMPLEAKAPFLYMLSAFPFLGILAADILLALREESGKPGALLLMVQAGAIVLLSAIRLQWRIPVSGHVLLLAFFVLRSWSLRDSSLHKREMWIGLIVLMVLTGVKLLAWHDWVTVVWAIGIACVIWLAGLLTGRRATRRAK